MREFIVERYRQTESKYLWEIPTREMQRIESRENPRIISAVTPGARNGIKGEAVSDYITDQLLNHLRLHLKSEVTHKLNLQKVQLTSLPPSDFCTSSSNQPATR